VTAKQSAVKRYIVKLSDAERERLDALTNIGKHPARLLTKARILLKADASAAGEGWSDSRIAEALDTSTDTVARTRQQLVEEGFEAVLVRKHSPASARPRIFDGASEAKLIALACSPPPKGRKRWTLQLLEEAVVELNIVERASDNIPRLCENPKFRRVDDAEVVGDLVAETMPVPGHLLTQKAEHRSLELLKLG
jgi:poly-gamma-glutamate capsule biosynthesis protein CapA/YwtB (metallophosphatase superfamily)